jgi:hypothetical protein
MKKNVLFLITIMLAFQISAPGQANAVYPQPTNLVTVPTAGIIPRGAYLAEFRLFSGGGIQAGISAGISSRFMFGVSYGGSNIIGNEKINWNNQPGVEIKYRFIEEAPKMPAVLIGFNSQGQGE